MMAAFPELFGVRFFERFGVGVRLYSHEKVHFLKDSCEEIHLGKKGASAWGEVWETGGSGGAEAGG